jgi:hypothetical protein
MSSLSACFLGVKGSDQDPGLLRLNLIPYRLPMLPGPRDSLLLCPLPSVEDGQSAHHRQHCQGEIGEAM